MHRIALYHWLMPLSARIRPYRTQEQNIRGGYRLPKKSNTIIRAIWLLIGIRHNCPASRARRKGFVELHSKTSKMIVIHGLWYHVFTLPWCAVRWMRAFRLDWHILYIIKGLSKTYHWISQFDMTYYSPGHQSQWLYGVSTLVALRSPTFAARIPASLPKHQIG